MNGNNVTTLKCVIERVLSNSKPLPEFPLHYISTSGYVYKLSKGKLRRIKRHKTKTGRYQVCIKSKSGYKTRFVHVLMLSVFGEDFDLGPTGLLDDIVEGKPKNKITEEEVKDIRRRKKGGESFRKLGEEYKISHTQIMRICSKEDWKNV